MTKPTYSGPIESLSAEIARENKRNTIFVLANLFSDKLQMNGSYQHMLLGYE